MTAPEYRATLAKLGLTQREAAELLGVSIRTAHGYANGWPIPKLVADYLGLLEVLIEQSKCRSVAS